MRRTLMLGLLLATCATMLTACGVKSRPAEVDGTDYPRVYPAAPENQPAAASGASGNIRGGTVYTRRPTKDSSGYYTPPPPATEILAQ